MKKEWFDFRGTPAEIVSLNTAVVGSGAAGYNADLRLKEAGQPDVAGVTEGVRMGTSRNTGSDKQTYYKLNLCGDVPDSPAAMARDLFAGRCVDGDLALCEAALSARCFFNLCEAGVPFPVNRYGEYVGYRTDHDPRARATSAGPLTSKLMTERLEQRVREKRIPVFDGYVVVSILKDTSGRACGLLALRRARAESEDARFALFNCRNIVYAVGGPAGIYGDSVYPFGHSGASGVAFEAGAAGRNLTEWQYGLASTSPRWNVSGSYMQVLPRFLSVDPDGTEHEFLADYYGDRGRCLSMVFRKGYEWPFDSRKAVDGSSVIDLLVYRERVLRGRRVYLDFRTNPFGLPDVDYASLAEDARSYLESAQACFGTPIDRLRRINAPAVELYRSKGVDLERERLEIALCAQHSNGGLAVDLWWRTNVPGLFAAGEAAGTHGVYRPGGSALNAGQVGSLRAAQYIARHGGAPLPAEEFAGIALPALEAHRSLARAVIGGPDTAGKLLHAAASRMSAAGGPIRDVCGMRKALAQAEDLLAHFAERVRVPSAAGLMRAYRLRDVLLCQRTVLYAMLDYAAHGGKSRGSALYPSARGEKAERLEELFRFEPDRGGLDAQIQEVTVAAGGCRAVWRPVHPIPEGGGFFENVWRGYRKNGNVF